jgi:hypothetical protein
MKTNSGLKERVADAYPVPFDRRARQVEPRYRGAGSTGEAPGPTAEGCASACLSSAQAHSERRWSQGHCRRHEEAVGIDQGGQDGEGSCTCARSSEAQADDRRTEGGLVGEDEGGLGEAEEGQGHKVVQRLA